MKKIALVAVLATSAAMAAPFNGFSVGANLGAAFTKFKFTSVATNKSASTSKTGFIANVFAGYTKTFNNMIVGADLGFGFVTHKINGASNTPFNFSFAPRVGYKFNETTAAYGKVSLGYQMNRFSATDKAHGYKNTNFVWMPAVGVEKFVNENVSVAGEVGYKVDKINLKTGSTAAANYKNVSRNSVVLTIGANYSF